MSALKGPAITGLLIAAILGTGLWIALAQAGARAEPWDTDIYWQIGYPAAIIAVAMLGFAWPAHAKVQALLFFAMQCPVMLLNGAGLELLPLGVIAILVLALPGVGAAALASRLRHSLAR